MSLYGKDSVPVPGPTPKDHPSSFISPLSYPLPHFIMATSRRTRSGRPAHSAPAKRIRTKQGCLTCRIRRKKCDESREFGGGCETCSRLHIECLGYSNKRPEWLKGARVDEYKRQIKHFLADNGARSSTRSPDQAFLGLQHLKESSGSPREHSESVHTDTESDYYSDPVSPVEQKIEYHSPLHAMTALPSITETQPAWMPDLSAEVNWSSPTLDFYGYTDDQCPSMMSLQGTQYSPFPTLDTLSLVSGPMHYNEHSITLSPVLDPCQLDPNMLQVTSAQYEYPASSELVDTRPIWQTFTALLPLAAGDPEGVGAVLEVLNHSSEHLLTHNDFLAGTSTGTEDLRQMRQRAKQRLLRSGYDRPLSRAVTSLLMMQVTLRQGHFGDWGDCLDFVIDWIRNQFSLPSARVSSLGEDDRRVLRHGLWAELIATATRKQVPVHIDIYRRILDSEEPAVLACSNKVTSTFVEVIALAANPSHLAQAQARMQQFRENLVVPTDDLESISAAHVHTIGINLYLETVASRGTINPAVQDSVRASGCHTKDANRWSNCSMMMKELIRTEGGDSALQAAFEIMDETYNNRKREASRQITGSRKCVNKTFCLSSAQPTKRVVVNRAHPRWPVPPRVEN
ncbi:Fungal Zn(2)-Cys(6) binuclear cluster domain [Rhizoctonia solani]|uniref:Fungal Zn(2)-Cys(6) binuclear cluster domain n=1 Tax=Rhizoctonia solani TaxID=456999 RepID=A0A8H8NST3_9AGAM|nr:Fungal Zn(2)-Cys(6) binuclear cluster domain [Rhizoctonia solani]QRW17766.1 Fungal Zn(2)-Cys(6) binuclear cluster domain [Rhizoctonia solani]